MQSVSTKVLFKHCYGDYGIPAVNIFTMEQVLALFEASSLADSPVIVQITPVARRYATPEMYFGMIGAAAKIFPKCVYAIHLDHGNEEHALNAIKEGYSSVMIDASHDDFEKNISRTRVIVSEAHKCNVAVEAELGVLSGVEDDMNIGQEDAKYTNPQKAREFIDRTGCDSLAVAVGTSHGAYKFNGANGLRLDILKSIQDVLPPNFPLVLHGSSNVDKRVVAEINQYGGKLKENASGVTDNDLKSAISLGICKVNIATDLRLLWAKVHRKFFKEQPELFDPIIPGREYMEAYKNFMIGRFEVLGSSGKAKSIK